MPNIPCKILNHGPNRSFRMMFNLPFHSLSSWVNSNHCVNLHNGTFQTNMLKLNHFLELKIVVKEKEKEKQNKNKNKNKKTKNNNNNNKFSISWAALASWSFDTTYFDLHFSKNYVKLCVILQKWHFKRLGAHLKTCSKFTELLFQKWDTKSVYHLVFSC